MSIRPRVSGSSVSSLYLRPWYGNRTTTALPHHDMDSLGPTISAQDHFPRTSLHPMWIDRSLFLEPDAIEVEEFAAIAAAPVRTAPGRYLSIKGDELGPPQIEAGTAEPIHDAEWGSEE